MNTQINLRLPDELLENSREYAKKHGFGNVQELIKESLREKVFEEPKITKEELELIKKLKEKSISYRRGISQRKLTTAGQ